MSTTIEPPSVRAEPAVGKALGSLVQALAGLAGVSSANLQRGFEEVARQPRRTKALLRQLDHLREALVAASAPAEPVPGTHDALPELLRSGQVLEAAVFAQRLGWTRQALSKALQANRVFCLESGGVRFYPAFYADARYERRHLEAVSKLLGDIPGGAKWLFFTSPKASLSRLTPLQALAQGRLAAVKAAAEGYAQR